MQLSALEALDITCRLPLFADPELLLFRATCQNRYRIRTSIDTGLTSTLVPSSPDLIAMPKTRAANLEQRLADVERRVEQLQSLLTTRTQRTDWRQSIGAFTDRPGVLAILEEAQQLREADRRRSRPRRRVRAKA